MWQENVGTGKQNFDGDKNNSKIAGTVANTFLNSRVFFRSKRHIGQKESEISIFSRNRQQ